MHHRSLRAALGFKELRMCMRDVQQGALSLCPHLIIAATVVVCPFRCMHPMVHAMRGVLYSR
jgi:hypothetical protein